MKVDRIHTRFGDVIVIEENDGTTGVYTRRDSFGDIRHQFSVDEPFLQVYFEAIQLVDTGYFMWQGDCAGDDDLTEEELDERIKGIKYQNERI